MNPAPPVTNAFIQGESSTLFIFSSMEKIKKMKGFLVSLYVL
jgi:hypothetical protein